MGARRCHCRRLCTRWTDSLCAHAQKHPHANPLFPGMSASCPCLTTPLGPASVRQCIPSLATAVAVSVLGCLPAQLSCRGPAAAPARACSPSCRPSGAPKRTCTCLCTHAAIRFSTYEMVTDTQDTQYLTSQVPCNRTHPSTRAHTHFFCVTSADELTFGYVDIDRTIQKSKGPYKYCLNNETGVDGAAFNTSLARYQKAACAIWNLPLPGGPTTFCPDAQVCCSCFRLTRWCRAAAGRQAACTCRPALHGCRRLS